MSTFTPKVTCGKITTYLDHVFPGNPDSAAEAVLDIIGYNPELEDGAPLVVQYKHYQYRYTFKREGGHPSLTYRGWKPTV